MKTPEPAPHTRNRREESKSGLSEEGIASSQIGQAVPSLTTDNNPDQGRAKGRAPQRVTEASQPTVHFQSPNLLLLHSILELGKELSCTQSLAKSHFWGCQHSGSVLKLCLQKTGGVYVVCYGGLVVSAAMTPQCPISAHWVYDRLHENRCAWLYPSNSACSEIWTSCYL